MHAAAPCASGRTDPWRRPSSIAGDFNKRFSTPARACSTSSRTRRGARAEDHALRLWKKPAGVRREHPQRFQASIALLVTQSSVPPTMARSTSRSG